MEQAAAANAEGAFKKLSRSLVLRLALIGGLILVLQIPMLMIRGVINERETTREGAKADITRTWGLAQAIQGPRITVPFIVRERTTENDKIVINRVLKYAHFLPEDLQIEGQAKAETRYRGIFEVPVYRLDVKVRGEFNPIDLSKWGVASTDVLWDRAYLSLGISDARAISTASELSWDGEGVAFQPSAGEALPRKNGIHVLLKNRVQGSEKHAFSFEMKLNGSLSTSFAPMGRRTRVALTSNWPDPKFEGAWLPRQRTVTEQGFRVAWDVPDLGRSFPQAWIAEPGVETQINAAGFGVAFISPVDHYRMAHRSIKYEILFLLLTFGTLWMFEVLAGVRIHPIQYLLVGAAQCMFYLLEIALAEHIGFALAYAIASASVIMLIGTYCVAFLGKVYRAFVVGGVVTVLYGYLFLLLRSQAYSLLAGSIGLFVVLALVMYLTRKVDWHKGLPSVAGSES